MRVAPHARRLTLRLCAASRSVKLSVPPRLPPARAIAFLAAQSGWLEQQAMLRVPAPVPFIAGGRLPFRGGSLLLMAESGRSVRQADDRLLVPGGADAFAGRVRRWLEREARQILVAETHALAHRLGVSAVRVRLGDPAGRWGSCGPEARINYSWRLVMAPDFVRAAVVAHEVAHLRHPDHGRDFWRLAAELLGGPHAPARAWLSANGPMLHAQGADR